MWQPLLEPGRVAVLSGPQRLATGFFQELTHFAVHRDPGAVLWCDGSHTFNPAEFGELNLVRGYAADDGASRVLVKRCMTPFQWDSTLSQHLEDKLTQAEASLVVVNPFDALWTHEEIQDWEQEDYLRFSLGHLQEVARRHKVPIVLGCDVDRLMRSHPVLAQAVLDGVADRWTVGLPGGRWRLTRSDGVELDPTLRRQVTLLDFVPSEERVALVVPTRKRKDEAEWRPFVMAP